MAKSKGRHFSDFLTAYLDYTKDSEAPESYHKWVGMAIVGAVVGRRTWVTPGRFTLHPNMYVILIAPPGETRKSSALIEGKAVLSLAEDDLVISADALSTQRMYLDIARAYSKTNDESNYCILSGEFGSIIGHGGALLINFLTDIYNADQDEWEYRTKSGGIDSLRKPVVSVVGATTPAWLASEFPVAAVEGGFTARAVFVYEEKSRFREAFGPPIDKAYRKRITEDLRAISLMKGEVTYSKEAKARFQEIYTELRPAEVLDYRLRSFFGRREIHMHKICMVRAMCQDRYIIEVSDIEEANIMLDEIAVGLPRVFAGIGKNEYAVDLDRMTEMLEARGGEMSHQDIHAAMYHVGGVDEVDGLIKQNVARGVVTETQGPGGMVRTSKRKGRGE